jgi:hypothetical protein
MDPRSCFWNNVRLSNLVSWAVFDGQDGRRAISAHHRLRITVG